MLALYFSVDKQYRSDGVWLMNDETALKLKTLKDENGQYLWNQNSDTVLGKPVLISEFMPSEVKPIAFGDLSYYYIVDRLPLTVRTLHQLFAMTRVAAYARVSSAKDAMRHSLSAQVSYYSGLIQQHPGWAYAGVYSDEAKTGTKDSREGFTRLLADCRAGRVDAVITKSISRFARNTVTLLETVRELKGLGVDVYFEEQNIPTPRGKAKWQTSTIESILMNEKYKGSAILQKKFTVDFLSKKMKVNEGEVPQYIVEESHPAIIDPDQWKKVQDEMAVRKAKGRHHNSLSPFSAKLVCGDCGEFYGSKVWHSTDKYRRVIWQCNGKFKGERRCGTPHLTEEDVRRLFLQAVSQIAEERDVLLETCAMLRDEYLNTEAIDAELDSLADEMEVVEALTKKLIAENATTAMPQDEYNRKYDVLVQRYHTAEERTAQLQGQKVRKRFQADVMDCFITELMTLDALLPVQYSDRLWLNLIDRVTIYEDGSLVFRFKNGAEITEML